jgi:hypothetical protein
MLGTEKMYGVKMRGGEMTCEHVSSEMCPKADFGVSGDETSGLLLWKC